MYIPEKMKVNQFVDVAIPSTKSLFARLGQSVPKTESFSGDDVVTPPLSKVDSIVDYMQYAEEEAKKQSSKDE